MAEHLIDSSVVYCCVLGQNASANTVHQQRRTINNEYEISRPALRAAMVDILIKVKQIVEQLGNYFSDVEGQNVDAVGYLRSRIHDHHNQNLHTFIERMWKRFAKGNSATRTHMHGQLFSLFYGFLCEEMNRPTGRDRLVDAMLKEHKGRMGGPLEKCPLNKAPYFEDGCLSKEFECDPCNCSLERAIESVAEEYQISPAELRSGNLTMGHCQGVLPLAQLQHVGKAKKRLWTFDRGGEINQAIENMQEWQQPVRKIIACNGGHSLYVYST